ncbi:crossover junction endodeoxyribonuclease RuvC [Wenzhouxiangella sp. EGI_FJ10409]|uniref:crossover junction endodeoxyribonuclease RuvC n=1 Tax=Wenzhouxiangella sp. EGI_FJ10409 TaxID=3243767 RepID=UPI0035D7E16B
MRILGLDPGSRKTGVGIIEGERLIHAETLKLGGGPMPERLGLIFTEVQRVIAEHAPEVAAVETVFMSRNAQAAIKLGQARGAAICAVVGAGLAVHEYAPREIKQAIVGRGGAGKEQVQHMIRALMRIDVDLGEDAHDALAVALCHHHTAQTASRLPPGVVLR